MDSQERSVFMTRKIVLAALLSTLAVSGLAVGGDRAAKSERCNASFCPIPCGACPQACSASSSEGAEACEVTAATP
jgi:hypothetical protein